MIPNETAKGTNKGIRQLEDPIGLKRKTGHSNATLRYHSQAKTATILLLLAQAITLSLAVLPAQASSFDFKLANSGQISAQQGSGGSNTITVTWTSGIPQTVSLACTNGVPSGAQCFFSPDSNTPSYTSSLTIFTFGDTTPIGSYAITVTGTGAGISRTTQFLLVVGPPAPPPLVGASVNPIDKLALVTPFIALALVAALGATLLYARRVKRRENTQ